MTTCLLAIPGVYGFSQYLFRSIKKTSVHRTQAYVQNVLHRNTYKLDLPTSRTAFPSSCHHCQSKKQLLNLPKHIVFQHMHTEMLLSSLDLINAVTFSALYEGLFLIPFLKMGGGITFITFFSFFKEEVSARNIQFFKKNSFRIWSLSVLTLL